MSIALYTQYDLVGPIDDLTKSGVVYRRHDRRPTYSELNFISIKQNS